MSNSTHSYKDLFEYQTLERISGQPTYASLNLLKKQLQANAASVPSTLGGGANGHLGLVLTPQQYTFISLRPFVRPNHPGVLIIPPGITNEESERLRHNQKVHMDLFTLTHSVEKTLIQQLVAAIDPVYVEELRNNTTGLIDKPLHEILLHLFNNYGQVDGAEYNNKYIELLKHQYDPDKPIDEIFTKIVDFINLAEAASMPVPVDQALHIGCGIIRQCGVFVEALKRWNKKPTAEKTWNNFKAHFRSEHKEYRSTLPTTTRQADYSANMIAQQVANQLWEKAQEVQDVEPPIMHTPPMYQPPPSPMMAPMPPPMMPPTSPPTLPPYCQPVQSGAPGPAPFPVMQQANAMIHDQTLTTLIANVKDLTTTINNMKIQQNNQQYFQQPNLPNGQKGATKKNKPKRYCWSHGLCGHDGFHCKQPAQGHNPYATIQNMMGGNTKGTKKNKAPQQSAFYSPPPMQQQFVPQQQAYSFSNQQTNGTQYQPRQQGATFPPPGQYYGQAYHPNT